MTDEQVYESQISDSELTEFQRKIRRLNLGASIARAFKDSSPENLRQWYVETFVLDPTNTAILADSGEVHPILAQYKEDIGWPSVEHAAIGHRLIFMMDEGSLFSAPNLLEPDSWRNEFDVTNTLMLAMRPWERFRYDPVGENWYQRIVPGQWLRHGKGAPGQNAVEYYIHECLVKMDLIEGANLYSKFPLPDTSGYSADELSNRLSGSVAALRKFRSKSVNVSMIRKTMETSAIMFLDTTTLNRIRTLSPFSNGVLALVEREFTDTENVSHKIYPGTLLPMNVEYMFTRANTLNWDDPKRRIPDAVSDWRAADLGDTWAAEELEDELLLNECPTYWSFLTHAFPEPDERSAFLRLLGAAMYGTNLKIVAAMIGEPNAGKDTVINWLSYLMPGQVATLPFSAFTPHGDDDRGFAPLIGARVATVSGEVGEGRGSKLLAEKIKTVSSGGGKIRVAEKYEKPTDIWFDGMLFLQGNSVPTIAGGDRALYTNRLVAVEFKHPFPLVSTSFESRYRTEAPAFAQVLFLNYWRYQMAGGGMSGINPPKTWRAFAKEFADQANPHGFLESCIVPSDKPVPTQQFHQALSAMAQRFGSPHAVGPNYWPKRLRALGFQTKGPHSVRKQIGSDRRWYYMLTLNAELSDGAFTQEQWNNELRNAAVTV